jgi:hypothetical protein
MAFDWTSLIGPALGAWAGYKAGGDQTQTVQNTIPAPMMNQWQGYTNFANQLANRPYQNTVAPFTQDQYGAMDQIRAQSQGGPEQQAGSQALQSFLSGGNKNPYMGDNPYLSGMIKRSNDEIMGRMNTGAFNSGSFGNSGVAETTAKAIGDSTNALQFANYQNSANLAESGLNRQASMIPQALTYQNQNLANSSALLQSGAMQQQQGQKTLDNWWNYPMQQLGIMGQPLGFNIGQNSTTSIPGNPWASALGGGLLGLQLGNAMGSTPPPQR